MPPLLGILGRLADLSDIPQPTSSNLINYSLRSIAAAAICAMSSSFGGVFEIPESASRNMVLQNGQAAPMTVAPVATSSSARVTLTRCPDSSPRNASPPPAPQQKE